MSWRKYHNEGSDVLGGVSVGDFVPWLGVVGKVAGGLLGGIGDTASGGKGTDGKTAGPSTQEQIKKALKEQQQKEALQKAQAAATRNEILLFTTLGIVGLGTTVLLLKRR